MTYSAIDRGNYTKVFDRSHYSANIPYSIDWRTSNAVTSIKNQVYVTLLLHETHDILYFPVSYSRMNKK